jgi:hypothetical protein
MKSSVFCAIKPCNPVKVNGRFGCVARERLLTVYIKAYLGHGMRSDSNG